MRMLARHEALTARCGEVADVDADAVPHRRDGAPKGLQHAEKYVNGIQPHRGYGDGRFSQGRGERRVRCGNDGIGQQRKLHVRPWACRRRPRNQEGRCRVAADLDAQHAQKPNELANDGIGGAVRDGRDSPGSRCRQNEVDASTDRSPGKVNGGGDQPRRRNAYEDPVALRRDFRPESTQGCHVEVHRAVPQRAPPGQGKLPATYARRQQGAHVVVGAAEQAERGVRRDVASF
mmetsp:Transcript_4881/g.13683  ORF Transcript_4881/g.13683 Transcript_4881/m.13683 type:complete len:233 (-) Transcript_4881:347-1045(-)